MSWKLTPRDHVVYPRNPLVAVTVDLRFHPILKVADRIADFQERLRKSHPVFQQGQQQLVNLQPLGGIQIRTDQVFSFSTPDGNSVLTLNTSALILESRAHQTRDELVVTVDTAIEALLGVYGFATPVRLGLRYVNVIDREAISAAIGAPVDWSELVRERFVNVPGGLVDPTGAYFHAEVSAPVAGVGAMTLRYGRVPDVKDKREKFLFDIDRYTEQGFEVASSTSLLSDFSDDIYWLFSEAMGPKLESWMNKEGA
jgi:uncharacterized protein (TIGR04255 family)